jgi:hypothetical protein
MPPISQAKGQSYNQAAMRINGDPCSSPVPAGSFFAFALWIKVVPATLSIFFFAMKLQQNPFCKERASYEFSEYS